MKLLVPLLASALVLPLAALRLGSAAQEAEPGPALPVTVFLLRHAEPAPAPASAEAPDPGLSEAGRARARALARLLGRSGADLLIASEYARARETLAPLAEALGLAVEAAPAADVAALAARLGALAPGTVAVVAGHSNTVPALAAALGAPPLPGTVEDPRHGTLLPHEEHDRVVQIVLPACPDGAPAVIELSYGPAEGG